MKRSAIPTLLFAALLLVASVLAAPRLAKMESGEPDAAVPSVISYQGLLTDKETGEPIQGEVLLTFHLFGHPSGSGGPLWSESHPDVSLDRGLFDVMLGVTHPITAGLMTGERYLGVQVGAGEVMTPLQALGSVPYALIAQRANDANTLDGLDSSAFATSSGLTALEGRVTTLEGQLVDGDGDGYYVGCEDCDDGDPDRNPGAAEDCDDGVDNDCDDAIDCADAECTPDDDTDGQFPPPCGPDCDDTDRDVFAGSPEFCDYVDNDCDALVDEDYVDGSGRYIDQQNCGFCGNDCTLLVYPNGQGMCRADLDPPACAMDCVADCFDANGETADGCECCGPAANDYPDTDGIDADCDGLDGEADNGVFVAPHGDDGADGSWAAPLQTIQAGIDLAAGGGKRDVYVATGVYTGSVTLTSTVGVYGGYSTDFRSRDSTAHAVTILSPTPGPGKPGAVNCLDLNGGAAGSVVLDGVTVFGYQETTPGSASYAIYVRNCDDTLRLSNNRVYAGRGGDGLDGTLGYDGEPGTDGVPGIEAIDLYQVFGVTEHNCTSANHMPGGQGGLQGCSGGTIVSGGTGGERTCPTFDESETGLPTASEAGQEGANGGGAGGAAGRDVYHQAFSCAGYTLYDDVLGERGLAGTPGLNGPAGVGCTSPEGVVLNGLWVPDAPTSAGNGGHGGGGGGGGSGAGAYTHIACFSAGYGYDNLGATGGGGGSGGCGGTAGNSGTSGGGAFALFIVFDGPPPSVPQIVDNQIHGGLGGSGGSGGQGGTGGVGGWGAPGGSGGPITFDPPSARYPAFEGGAGGDGGRGGHGGGGGGGCGGPTYGIYAYGQGAADLTAWLTGNWFLSAGTGGTGGSGGFSLGNRGDDGSAGTAADTNF